MGAGELNFALNGGSSFTIKLKWLFPDNPENLNSDFNTPQDLTGWTGFLVCDDLSGFPLELSFDNIGNIYGQILDTSMWQAGVYDYHIEMIAPDSTKDILVHGKIRVVYVPTF